MSIVHYILKVEINELNSIFDNDFIICLNQAGNI